MAESRRSRQRQTRLSFTPLPSSSPAAKGYNKQIQERAAAVTLDSSPRPAKRHETGRNGINNAIPTPAASNRDLQVRDVEDSDSESEPVRSTQRPRTQQTASRRTTARQQRRLDFSNARDSESFSLPIKLSSPARPRSSVKPGMFASQRSVVHISSDDDDETDVELPSPRKLVAPSHSASDGGRSEKEMRSTTAISDDDDDIVVSSRRSRAIEVESEDEMPTTAGTQRQRRKRVRQASPDSFVASSPPQMQDSDDDLEIIEPPTKRQRKHISSDQGEDDDDESEPITPRRRLQSRRKMSKRDAEEKEELEEELEFLGAGSDVEMSARKARNVRSTARNARLKALEALKRKRQSSQVDGANDAEAEVDQNDETSDEDHEDDEDGPDYVQPTRSSQMFQADEDDEDFIVSADEENTLGIPDDLPLEFTRFASMKPKELFKHAVEWFVQKKINPAFQINDAIYDLTFRKLDDEVTGLAGSKFKSAAWTFKFTTSLNARPQIAFQPIDDDEYRDTCDACNRTHHPATFHVQFQGQPYHRETLEDLAGNDDDDDDDPEGVNDDDGSSESRDRQNGLSYDEKGREVQPENYSYYVGKYCMSNAQTAHALQHWRYHLNEWVIDWLTKNGYQEPTEVVKRDGWSTKKRRKYADKIVDQMEQQGVVKQLYRLYKKNIDEARDDKQGRYGAWE